MHPAVVLLGEEPLPVDLMQGGDHPVAPLLVQGAHLFQMAEEVAVVDEGGEDLLRQHRLAAGEQIGGIVKGRHRAGGHHHVAETQRRHHGFAEGAHVDHPILKIEAFQRRQHLAGVVKFAVVIILDDPGVILPGPVKQLLPAG